MLPYACPPHLSLQRLALTLSLLLLSPSLSPDYMAERLGVPADEVAEKCADLYLNYGTTLAGLVASGCVPPVGCWKVLNGASNGGDEIATGCKDCRAAR